MRFIRKFHQWAGILLAIFILLFSVSGIIMNHRDLFASFSVSRSWMPKDYHYRNWNNAAVKSVLETSDGFLVYGNIGVWKFDQDFEGYRCIRLGNRKGIDSQKTVQIFSSENGHLYACGLFGFYFSIDEGERWEEIILPTNEKLVGISEDSGRIFVLSRSELFHIDKTDHSVKAFSLALPPDYNHKIGLFRTLWEIHSGEFLGIPGKLLVDAMALIFILLSLTGIVYFFAPGIMKRLAADGKKKVSRARKLSLKWHNWLGLYPAVFLLITTITGMFLRPPLLIPIANKEVSKIKYTHLDHPNPWYDKLRSIYYDSEHEALIIGSSDGFYFTRIDGSELYRVPVQPPVSVMGINVFEKTISGNYLVGSFSGLFEWNPFTGMVFDYIEKRPYAGTGSGRPIGAHVVAGYAKHPQFGELVFDYSLGARNLSMDKTFIRMPEPLADTKMSLWNFALEVHTARFYQFLFGPAYILFIPLIGLIIILLLVSGILVWFTYHTGKKRKFSKTNG